jgi:hypothetical protein
LLDTIIIKGEKMVDEEKLKNIQKALTELIPNDGYNYYTEKGKIVFQQGMLISTCILIMVIGILVLFGFALPNYTLIFLSVVAIGYIIYSEIIINNFYVVDYVGDKFYFEKRRNDQSISKKVICSLKDVVAVGVNNKLRYRLKGDKEEDIRDDFVEESALVFLKNDGKIINIIGFMPIRYSYDNNCIISNALSELYNIPKLNCRHGKQLKVIKKGLKPELSEEPLQKNYDILKIMFLFIFLVFGMALIAMVLVIKFL